ncbi:MAG: hypothetical protein ACXVW8_04725 [Nocardioidaceae bacterium]
MPGGAPTASGAPVPGGTATPSASPTVNGDGQPTTSPSPTTGGMAPAAPATDCQLTVPANPLSARGLATPYQLTGTGQGPCHEADPAQGAFVEATIVSPRTGAVRVYHPLVVDQGTQPAMAPVVPKLPRGSVVGIWFGFNGGTLSLGGSVGQGNCVNGLGGSKFGQFAYCNAPAFFTAANRAIRAGRLTVPALGTAKDGMPCPTVRDFSLVDQDQSDNVTSTYLATADGRTAQNSAANAAGLAGATKLTNGSDNRLLDAFVDPALGCQPFTAPDLTDNGQATPSLALNELQAAAHQAAPAALIPPNDPMAMVGGQPSTRKANLYRAGVDQPALTAGETGQAYCSNLSTIGQQRLTKDQNLFSQAPSPDAAMNLFDFLTQRLQGSFQMLGCQAN